ncbi:MAG: hypothetical protein C0485_15115 [Pirellula sp.]|nr:hypothetical protein [Pirellula sp.]
MLADGLAPATVGREVKRARQFFRSAVRRKLIPENPFADVAAPAQVNASRMHFITREVTERVLSACPDAEWRLIVALSRYGGLRCPSETLALRWEDIDWENNRINVRSPKTEHLPGGASRSIPLFRELRPYLEEARDLAVPGTHFVINRYRGVDQNLRTQFERILRKAEVVQWERLFHNLRASRETELTAEHPLHVVCTWIGNSAIIADKHYLQVTDDHFDNATGAALGSRAKVAEVRGGANCGAQDDESAARIAAQHLAASASSESPDVKKARKDRAKVQSRATTNSSIQANRVPRRGVEPLSAP